MIMREGVTRIAATYKAELRLGPGRGEARPRPGRAREEAGRSPGGRRAEPGRRPGGARREAGRRPGGSPSTANRPDAMRGRPVRLTRVESRSYGRRVPRALVPAAHTWPSASL